MTQRTKLILGGIAICLFLAYGAFSFQSALTPYVSFAEARTAGHSVQVAGKLDTHSPRYDTESRVLSFRLLDESGDALEIAYAGVKPVNFEDAASAVAIGTFENGVFNCSKLLVKCPSKYEQSEREYNADV